MRKALKVLAIVVVLLIAALIIIPIVFKDKFVSIIKEEINNSIVAKVDFDDIEISLISNFPKANLSIKKLSVVNYEPFLGDTLFYTNDISLSIPLSGLFRGSDQQIEISSFSVSDAIINIVTDKQGNANYDITKPDTTTTSSEKSEEPASEFSLAINKYSFSNISFNYIDQAADMKLSLQNLNHSGTGDLSSKLITLDTYTSSLISFSQQGSSYLDNNNISLDAKIEIDQENNKYTFLDNSFSINELKLIFEGYIKQNPDNIEMDIKFNTPSSSFKNFIAVLPKQYQKDIDKVITKGNFDVNGFAKGIVDDNNIPKFSIKLNSANASIEYPDLPKKIENINLNAEIANNTGKMVDTYLSLKQLSLRIDKDSFNAKADIKNITTNALVNASVSGTLNLASIAQAYPIELVEELKGILKADLNLSFAQQDIENSNYENINNSGQFSLYDFKFVTSELPHPFYISEAKVSFDTDRVKLDILKAKTGKSDIEASGTIEDIFGFVLSDKNLKGDFDLKAQLIDVNDFMPTDTITVAQTDSKAATIETAFKIPSFLDININANASTVIYDTYTLSYTKGKLSIKDQIVSIKDINAEIFDGHIKANGKVSTQKEIATFDMELDMNNLDINKTFIGMDMFAKLIPAADMIDGKFDFDMKLDGNLDNSLFPDLYSISGKAVAEILNAKVKKDNNSSVSKLDDKLSFIDLDKIDLNNLKATFVFSEGTIKLEPLNTKYKDIDIEIEGTHGFDLSMDYKATFDVPAKYLKEATGGLMAKISDKDLKGINIPVVALIKGTTTSPKISTDLSKAITSLSKQLVKIQADKLAKKGKETVKDLLNDLLGKGKSDDKTKSAKDKVKGVLKGLFN